MSCKVNVPLKLSLATIPWRKTPSIYGPTFPERMAFLHPNAAQDFIRMQRHLDWKLTISDMWRAASISLRRREQSRHAQPPGWSGHNWGFSIDIDVDAALKEFDCSKKELDQLLSQFNWYCHRRDGRLRVEAWHYNWLGLGEGAQQWLDKAGRSTAPSVEAQIVACYGNYWSFNDTQLQRYLKQLGLYSGGIDGDVGPLTESAVRAFQRQWTLKVDGVAGPKTRRVLSYRCAELSHSLLQGLWTVK